MHDTVIDNDAAIKGETRDRAVRRVLWLSVVVAVIPMLAALALVQPTLARRASAEAGQLQSELTAGRGNFGSLLSRSASGIVRAVQETLIPSDITVAPPDLRPLDDERAARRFTSTLERRGGAGGAAGTAASLDDVPLITLDPALSPRAAVFGRPALVDTRGSEEAASEWRFRNGAFVRDVGDASITLAGAVAIDDYSSLRPISDAGLGGYLSDAPELHHSALSGGLARTFEQGRWRLRPELDVEASYLALDKVRLDAGEAGLFLPEAEDWIFSARPSVALEGDLDAAAGFRLTPSLRAGATWLSQDEFSSAAMMLDTPATIAGVAAMLPVEELFADVEAGLGLAASDRVRLSVTYGRLMGQALEAETGRLELNMQF